MKALNISIFSLLSSFILFNFAALIIILNRNKTAFIIRYGINLLLLSSLLAFIRLILPIDLYNAKIIDIHQIYRPLKYFLVLKIGNELYIYQFLLLLWGIGTVLFLFYYLSTSILEIYKLNHLNCTPCPTLETLCSNYMQPKVIIKISPEVDVPKVWGFYKCRIYFPNYMLSPDEWKFILDHEVQHIKLHDTFIKMLLLFLTALFWWNPIMYILRKNIDQMLELRCDSKLAQNYSLEMQNKYLETILKVLRERNTSSLTISKKYLTASFVNHSAYSLTRQRFEMILNTKKLNKNRTFLCYCITVLLFVSSYFIILQPDEKMTTEPGPTLILHTSPNEYKLYINGTFSQNLTPNEIHSKKYSKYEIIEGSN